VGCRAGCLALLLWVPDLSAPGQCASARPACAQQAAWCCQCCRCCRCCRGRTGRLPVLPVLPCMSSLAPSAPIQAVLTCTAAPAAPGRRLPGTGCMPARQAHPGRPHPASPCRQPLPDLPVVRYHTGEFYAEHYDNKAGSDITRAATIIVYLCDTPAGGATYFPRWDGGRRAGRTVPADMSHRMWPHPARLLPEGDGATVRPWRDVLPEPLAALCAGPPGCLPPRPALAAAPPPQARATGLRAWRRAAGWRRTAARPRCRASPGPACACSPGRAGRWCSGPAC
jgi:hypothetical protein